MQTLFKIRKKIGFTLAEVLVTLAVIGIVAALTVPSLLKNYQEKQYKSAFKKAFSEISQVATKMLIENGDLSAICRQGVPLRSQMMLYMGYLKTCGTTTANDCFWIDTTPSFDYKSLSSVNVAQNRFDDGQFVMSNGMFVMLENPFGSANPTCIAWIDVNGYLKGPNVLGKDVYGVQFLNNRLVPMGAPGATTFGGCSSAEGTPMAGAGCAAFVLQNKDY